MPLHVEFDEHNGAIITGHGILTGKEIAALNRKLYGDPDRHTRLRYQLCDFSHVEDLDVSKSDIRTLARQEREAAQRNSNMIVAIAGDQDLVYGLGRMWQGYLDGAPVETEVFRTRDEAESWIETRLKAQVEDSD